MASKPKTSPYDSTAVVKRIEDGVAWVQIPGGVDETPVKLTVNAEAGDTVQVRVSGGTAFLVGNSTAPPTDDKTANAAQKIAVTAQKTADGAVEDAERAKNAADDAERSAASAQVSANNANEYASRALSGLSTVQSVAETLTWITQHGTMTLTTDTEIDPTHVYFVQDAQGDYVVGNVHYSVVAEPKAADLATYYVLSIDESLNNYVATHLALTSEGLWVVPDSSGYKVLISTGVSEIYSDAGMYVVGADGVIVARFSTSRTTIMGDGGIPVFDISTNGATETIFVSKYYDDEDPIAVYLIPRARISYYNIISVRYWALIEGEKQTGHVTFHADTDETKTIDTDISIQYTSSNSYIKVIFSRETQTQKCGITHISYDADVELPVFTLGTRGESDSVGGFSAVIGESLIASGENQTVLGKYNIEDTEDEYALIIGNGMGRGRPTETRSNAFAVDWYGNVKAAGHVSGTTEQLTITRTENSYVDATRVGYLRAVRKDGMLWFNGNITFSTPMPSGTTGWTEIAKISGWNAPYGVHATVAGQEGDGTLLVMVTEGGSVQIYNGSGKTVSGFHRCPMVAPAND